MELLQAVADMITFGAWRLCFSGRGLAWIIALVPEATAVGWVVLCLAFQLIWWNPWRPGFLVPQLHLSRAPTPKRVLPRAAEGVERHLPRDKKDKNVWSWNLFVWCSLVALYWLLGGRFVLWSAIAGLIGLRKWIGRSVVQRGSMASFACRGATLAVALAWLFERFLDLLILAAWPQLHFVLLETGLMSALGGVEELIKFISLIWFSWSGARFWRCKRPLAQLWPKEFMLAGFSLGVGFMVAENCRMFPLATRMFADEFSDFPNLFFAATLNLLFFRILLNPHPFLTGIAAGRFTKSSKAEKLTLETLWNVLWPSTLLHVLLNLVLSMPGGIVLRALGQILCWILFRKTWKSLEKPQESSVKDDPRLDRSAS
eukprot:s1010_g22.t1